MARKNAIVSVELNDNNLSFIVADTGSIELDVSALAGEVTRRAMLHGIVQKISDAAALGKDATPSDKYQAMRAVADRLIAGNWNKPAGESGAPVQGLIWQAYREVMQSLAAKSKKSVSDEKLRELYDAKDRAQQLALRTNPEIAKVIERIKSERATSTTAIDTDALLAELG